MYFLLTYLHLFVNIDIINFSSSSSSSSSPMPIKYPCTVCKFSVLNNHKAILCDICQNWTHLRRLTIVLGQGSSRANHACQSRDF